METAFLKKKKKKKRSRVNHLEFGELSQRLRRYKDYPVEFCLDVFGVNLDTWQKTAMKAMASNQKVAIAGCTGVGKDFLAANLIWWFLATHRYPKVICTAVKEETLRDNLWAELSMLQRKSPLIQKLFTFGLKKIAATGAEEEWFAVARTTSKRYSSGGGNAQAEGLAGKYAEDTLAVVDEASGVDDTNFDALEGSANTPRRKMLIIGNPLRRTGRFAQIFLDPRFGGDWYTQNVSYLDSVRTSGTPEVRAIREKWIEMYGKNSAYVQARVFGQFPSTSTDDTIFTREEIQVASEREVDQDLDAPICIGIDVARFGIDETVYVARRGMKMIEMICESRTDGPQVVGQAISIATKLCQKGEDPKKVVEFRIDETGLGGSGVVDPLREQGWQVAGVHNGSRSTMPDDYSNLGAELWMEDAKSAILSCEMIKDEILANQLETRQYKFTGKSRQRRLYTKDEMRRSGMGSPDRADAFVLAFADSAKLGIGEAELRNTITFM